jgi:hypothetical protein
MTIDPNEDPLEAPGAREALAAKRAASHRALRELHPGNRFRLMFGQPLLPQDGYNPDNEPTAPSTK